MKPLEQSVLKEYLHYDPDTGVFVRLIPNGGVKRGQIVGYLDKTTGYLRINVNGCLYYAHRLAWLYMTGEQPKEIDHKNGIRSDNRFLNLRNVSRKINCENQRSARKDGTSGYLGVSKLKNGKWRAHITTNGKFIALGMYFTAVEANQAYITAKRQIHTGGLL